MPPGKDPGLIELKKLEALKDQNLKGERATHSSFFLGR